MAYWVQEYPANGKNRSGYRSFMCDKDADIEKLPKVGKYGEVQDDNPADASPCSYGSDCFSIESSGMWILTKDTNEWKKI